MPSLLVLSGFGKVFRTTSHITVPGLPANDNGWGSEKAFRMGMVCPNCGCCNSAVVLTMLETIRPSGLQSPTPIQHQAFRKIHYIISWLVFVRFSDEGNQQRALMEKRARVAAEMAISQMHGLRWVGWLGAPARSVRVLSFSSDPHDTSRPLLPPPRVHGAPTLPIFNTIILHWGHRHVCLFPWHCKRLALLLLALV